MPQLYIRAPEILIADLILGTGNADQSVVVKDRKERHSHRPLRIGRVKLPEGIVF